MKAIFATGLACLLVAGCGQATNDATCDLTKLAVQIESWPNEEARTKATEQLNLAKEAQAKNDTAACETHKKQAEEALKL